MFKKITLLTILITTFLLGGCQNSAPANDSGNLTIVTTISHIADVTSIVGGDSVTVDPLMGPGSDPHLYSPSAGDVSRLQDADIIFYNGLFLEAQMEDIRAKHRDIRAISHFSFGWQNPEFDRERQACQI